MNQDEMLERALLMLREYQHIIVPIYKLRAEAAEKKLEKAESWLAESFKSQSGNIETIFGVPIEEARQIILSYKEGSCHGMLDCKEVRDLKKRLIAAETKVRNLREISRKAESRAEKAERERNAALSTVNNAYRAGAITVKDPRFILPGVESKGWYRTVSVLGDQHVEPNKKVVFRFEDEVSKPSEDQWSWIMGRFMKGE